MDTVAQWNRDLGDAAWSSLEQRDLVVAPRNDCPDARGVDVGAQLGALTGVVIGDAIGGSCDASGPAGWMRRQSSPRR